MKKVDQFEELLIFISRAFRLLISVITQSHLCRKKILRFHFQIVDPVFRFAAILNVKGRMVSNRAEEFESNCSISMRFMVCYYSIENQVLEKHLGFVTNNLCHLATLALTLCSN